MPADQLVDVDGLRIERLPPREGQKPLRQSRSAAGALHGVIGHAAQPRGVAREPALEKLDVADDDGEQVVEVVGDAAGELTDGLHLLRLPERLLGLQALGHLCVTRSSRVSFRRFSSAVPARPSGGQEQLALVLAPVSGVEEGDAMNQRAPGRIPLLDHVGQNRQETASAQVRSKAISFTKPCIRRSGVSACRRRSWRRCSEDPRSTCGRRGPAGPCRSR